jgi:Flp pilus assembly pilin Flp
LTTAQAKAELKPLGIELSKIGPVYRVGPRFGGEAQAYRSLDLQDALEVGKAQANINRSWSFKLLRLLVGEETESGQAIVEYMLLTAVISLGLIASMNILISAVQTAVTNISNRIVSASQSTTQGQ